MPLESAKEILEELISRQKEKQGRNEPNQRPVLTPEEMLLRLKRAFDVFQQQHELRAGQIVKWKPGLQNKRLPSYGDPAIVLEVLDDPVVDNSNTAGGPYFREKLDVVLGVIDPDGDFLGFHFDSRRFEPWA